MSLSDPISDMLTSIRNGHQAGRAVVEVPCSKVKTEIARLLKREGFVSDYSVEGAVKKTLNIFLKYGSNQEPAIQGVRRESTPGLRTYVAADEIPRVLGGMGIVILSTPAGLMTGRDAGKQGIGGEVVCSVW
jgi:small subunit ribosomal protein S8